MDAQAAAVSVTGIGVKSTIVNYFTSGPGWTTPETSAQTLTLTVSGSVRAAWVESPDHLLSVQPIDGALIATLPDGSAQGLRTTTLGYPHSFMDSTRYVSYAEPAPQGWTYQTFGWWYDRDDSQPSAAFIVGGLSVGSPTPGTAIPTSGTATFNGKLGAQIFARSEGLVVREVAAPMSLAVNFANRSASFSSADWRDYQSVYAGTALSGQLGYASQQNALSGVLTTANGQFSGQATAQFYGPTAREVGGAFVLIPANGSADRVVGGFGAAR